MGKIEEIKNLKTLLEQGAITPDEFNMLKKNILNKEEENSTGEMKESSPPINIPNADTKKSRKPYAIGCLSMIVIYIIIAIAMDYGSSNTSSPSDGSSSGNSTKHCRYCGKEYTGAGYYHFMDKCESSTEYDDMCSQKCCYESWNATHIK